MSETKSILAMDASKRLYLKPEVNVYALPSPISVLTTLSTMDVELEDLEDFGQL